MRQKFLDVLIFCLRRLREPSTWAAIAAVLGLLGINPVITDALGEAFDLAPELINMVAALVSVLAGGTAALLPERGGAVPGAPTAPLSVDRTNAPDKAPGSTGPGGA